MVDFEYENLAHNEGYLSVCGIDEAGRGPLAGPVCAAAVILPDGLFIEHLNDSKKLTEKRREELYDIITGEATAWSVAFATHGEIDEINILNATFLAMTRAVNGLQVTPDYALVDGNREPSGITVPCKTIIKGDGKSASIAAASILAKVTRDRYMLKLDDEYPQYGFAKHKGYPTKAHYEMIGKYGISPCHRLSFLKNLDAHGVKL